ncbi:MAG: alanine--tRNA ligase [Nanoarchaeota archaeon]|nr:alanine--tRNA ligase [Nanoarchaeota archaeon]
MAKTDKEIKKEFKAMARKDPDKFYATSVLKSEGFVRHECKKCGTFYWSTADNKELDVCGDPTCSGGFRFIGNSPAKNKMDYVGVWKAFAEFFEKRGYKPIKRYPVAARWRDDTDFVQASIYDFQPYVVSGEVEPPANPLVVPQFCLRFNDIDNVGITGAHYTGFVMIGQHAFKPIEEYDQPKYFKDIHDWIVLGLGIPKFEIKYHEDGWAGGGNAGVCMEYFCRGLELGNQVYMTHDVSSEKYKPLKLKVLDMGMGHERNSWISIGKSTSYETTFPIVCERLYKRTGIKVDEHLMKKFLPYSSYLNVDEVEDIDEAWADVAKKIGLSAEELKVKIQPLAAIYSIAEHSRSLLVALSDGVLPSNVGGGYNLRVILRRALALIDRYGWDISLPEVCEWHAEYLFPLFPELKENLVEVSKILEVEKRKYSATKEKTRSIVKALIEKDEKISEELLLELYDSHGVSPDIIEKEAELLGKKVSVPDDFYARVAARHADSQKKQETATKKDEKINLKTKDTKALYFDNYLLLEFEAKVKEIIEGQKEGRPVQFVVLDETAFYPTSGGQLHDIGKINGFDVVDVMKQGNVIIHIVASSKGKTFNINQGDKVQCLVDKDRRTQLAQHHTSTHIINGAARIILGNHVWQAGAAKFTDKARLDITHFDSISEDELKKIEAFANDIVAKDLPVKKSFIKRNIAEQKYGFRLYQGGAVPGKDIRVIEIPGFDVEACAGTHLNSTKEAGAIKILKTSKVQDGIVRIEFASGKAAVETVNKDSSILFEFAQLVNCDIDQTPGRARELFEKWKTVVKKGKQVDSIVLISHEHYSGTEENLLKQVANIFRTQPEHIVGAASKFLKQLKDSWGKTK